MMVFMLFSTCRPVRGATRSMIYDLQRKTFDIIPNDLYDILVNPLIRTIEEVKKQHRNKFDEIIDEYFDFLVRKDYIFFTNTPEIYPEMSLDWDYPFAISNAIIDIGPKSPEVTGSIKMLEDILCKHLQIRYYIDTTPSHIEEISLYLENSSSIIQCLQIVLPFSNLWERNVWNNLYFRFPRLSHLAFFRAPMSDFLEPIIGNRGYTTFSKNQELSCNDCGSVNTRNFAINIANFTEALQYNSCLNRKISIDEVGNIRNCPSNAKSYGNIRNTKLESIYASNEFQSFWHLKKDDIMVCQDCEFRYMCTDCRAYTEDPENILSKPLKCGYDPYTAEWTDWKIDPEKEHAITHYRLRSIDAH